MRRPWPPASTRPARPVRLHLPGRRRPGLHRHGGDHPRRHPRREDHRHLHQQRHLRHDRRPDGPDHAARPEARPRARGPRRRRWTAIRSGWPRCSPLLPGWRTRRAADRRPALIGQAKADAPPRLRIQIEGAGFSLVEVLSTCPTGWGMTPPKRRVVETDVVPTYPLGVIVDRPRQARAAPATAGGLTMQYDDRSSRVSAGRPALRRQAPGRGRHHEGREVFWMPSYGPEMRGGTATARSSSPTAPSARRSWTRPKVSSRSTRRRWRSSSHCSSPAVSSSSTPR